MEVFRWFSFMFDFPLSNTVEEDSSKVYETKVRITYVTLGVEQKKKCNGKAA